MNCMKCGREVPEGQLFCSLCLAEMEKYPVKPGIAIQLPHRKDAPVYKKASVRRRQPATPEEQIHKLRKRIRRLFVLWIATLLLLIATIYPAVEYFLGKSLPQPGQNYTAITSTEASQP